MIFYICCGSVIRYIGAELKVRKLSEITQITQIAPNTGMSVTPY